MIVLSLPLFLAVPLVKRWRLQPLRENSGAAILRTSGVPGLLLILTLLILTAISAGQSESQSSYAVGLYTSETVRYHEASYWTLHALLGPKLAAETESKLRSNFVNVRVLTRFPPNSADTADLDFIVVIENVSSRFWGRFTMNALAKVDFGVYQPDGTKAQALTEETTYKVSMGLSNESTQIARFDTGVTEIARSVAAKFVGDLQAQKLPRRAEPEPEVLVEIQASGSAQVYVDDEFKGTADPQTGRLVIRGLAKGPHLLRLSAIGFKDWKESVHLVAGTNHLQAQLEPAGPKPLELGEIEEALKSGISPKRVTELVKQFGVDFALTDQVEQRLRAAGADSDLLLAITKAKK